MQPFTTVVDWPEIRWLMEVSTMCWFLFCLFVCLFFHLQSTWYGRCISIVSQSIVLLVVLKKKALLLNIWNVFLLVSFTITTNVMLSSPTSSFWMSLTALLDSKVINNVQVFHFCHVDHNDSYKNLAYWNVPWTSKSAADLSANVFSVSYPCVSKLG